MSFAIPPLLPNRPNKPWRIGIVGAGAIANAGHLPAYAAQKWQVRGIVDADPDRALAAARRFALPKVYANLEEIIADPTIEILDIAIPPMNQTAVVQKAIRAGKHVLCQIPLSEEIATARRIVQLAQSSGVTLAVNHQMRWDSVIRSVKNWAQSGVLGSLQEAEMHVNVMTDWKPWPWMVENSRLDLLFHSIHFLDSIRHLFGEPQTLYCEIRKASEQVVAGETRSIIVLNYSSGALVLINVNHSDWSGRPVSTFRFTGTEAVVQGTFGLLHDYTHCVPDTIEVHLKQNGQRRRIEVDERWVPDAFAGPMAELMLSLEEGREPLTGGSESLLTLELVHAAYMSACDHKSIRPALLTW